MNNIFEITNNFDFNKIKLGVPNILNHGNHFSKITNNDTNKNIYVQLPQCYSKSGIVNTGQKMYCDLIFKANDNYIADFFENLEEHLTKSIYNTRDDWFYEANDMTIDDIRELMMSSIKSYKSGKCFLVRSYVKNDKLLIYNDEQFVVSKDEYDISHPIIPLININGIKFSSKAIIIEYILTQFMIINENDEFENQILINNKSSNLGNNEIQQNKSNNNETSIPNQIDIEKTDEENKKTDIEKTDEENKQTDIEEKTDIEESKQTDIEEKTDIEESKQIEQSTSLEETMQSLNKLENIIDYNNNNEFCEVSSNDLPISESIKIKDKNEIYLELYHSAKKRAKEIRNNAIEAFLHAKSIKTKYNLESLIETDSDTDYDSDNND